MSYLKSELGKDNRELLIIVDGDTADSELWKT
jgi:hypothetical protein